MDINLLANQWAPLALSNGTRSSGRLTLSATITRLMRLTARPISLDSSAAMATPPPPDPDARPPPPLGRGTSWRWWQPALAGLWQPWSQAQAPPVRPRQWLQWAAWKLWAGCRQSGAAERGPVARSAALEGRQRKVGLRIESPHASCIANALCCFARHALIPASLPAKPSTLVGSRHAELTTA